MGSSLAHGLTLADVEALWSLAGGEGGGVDGGSTTLRGVSWTSVRTGTVSMRAITSARGAVSSA